MDEIVLASADNGDGDKHHTHAKVFWNRILMRFKSRNARLKAPYFSSSIYLTVLWGIRKVNGTQSTGTRKVLVPVIILFGVNRPIDCCGGKPRLFTVKLGNRIYSHWTSIWRWYIIDHSDRLQFDSSIELMLYAFLYEVSLFQRILPASHKTAFLTSFSKHP